MVLFAFEKGGDGMRESIQRSVGVRLCVLLAVVVLSACGGHGSGPGGTPTPYPTPGIPPVAGETQTTGSGLHYIDVKIGDGATPQPGQLVTVRSRAWLASGSPLAVVVGVDPSGQPLTFTLGQGRMYAGFEEGVASMKVGGTRRLIVPPELAAGAQGSHDANNVIVLVPPNATIIYDVDLLDVRDAPR
jgi:hypothetical protein